MAAAKLNVSLSAAASSQQRYSRRLQRSWRTPVCEREFSSVHVLPASLCGKYMWFVPGRTCLVRWPVRRRLRPGSARTAHRSRTARRSVSSTGRGPSSSARTAPRRRSRCTRQAPLARRRRHVPHAVGRAPVNSDAARDQTFETELKTGTEFSRLMPRPKLWPGDRSKTETVASPAEPRRNF